MKHTTETCLSSSIRRYIELKQALGRDFARERRVLETIETFMIRTGATDWTQSAFEQWCRTFAHLSPTVRRDWMRIARNFCLYLRRTEPTCFAPDVGDFPRPHQPVQPHIFTDPEIIRLLQAAAKLKPVPRSPLRPEIFHLAIVLLNTTGMRRGELANLTIADYDQRTRSLLVREAKFHRSRYLPLSTDASLEVETYLATRRQCHLPMEADSPLLWNRYCNGYSGCGLGDGIHELIRESGIRTTDGRLPRVHDMRHSFAIRVLLRWYKAGVDVQVKLPALATYMGHVSIASTEYYLPFVPELAAAASNRFAGCYGKLIRPFLDRGAS
ncbi:tyrosine-type recombinase/integrase [Cupriavidus sp. CV2]|uniref:tyrosine-type recombinase/integrase n=1 Tax=Cupriavidus ulmosensis TaxID=3065913 RepID=UPI00296A945C|nr:tyrosine-type recombinase/integrase [Cupriavidus sp. CV2]MDW3687800.1 tyrosine-type recombinase/integrase [Cupriavidus sp. CV2]